MITRQEILDGHKLLVQFVDTMQEEDIEQNYLLELQAWFNKMAVKAKVKN